MFSPTRTRKEGRAWSEGLYEQISSSPVAFVLIPTLTALLPGMTIEQKFIPDDYNTYS